MNGTERIIEQIAREAKADADAVLEAAQRDADEVRAQYKAQADELYEKKLEEGRKQIADRTDSAARIAAMEARKTLLAAKQEMISAVFDRTAEKLAALPEGELTDFLAKLAAEAAEDGGEEVLLSARDAHLAPAVCEKANALLAKAGRKAALKPAKDAAQISGGVVLRRGRIEINCAVELLVERMRGEMSARVADILFA